MIYASDSTGQVHLIPETQPGTLCGPPRADLASSAGPVAIVPNAAYKITIWCESDRDEPGLAMALEQGELWDVATNVQYKIDPARDGT